MGLLAEPPVEFLLHCSRTSLDDFELSRLNRAANLRKQLRDLYAQLVSAEAEAVFARWLIEHRSALLELSRTGALQESLNFVAGSIVQAGPQLSAGKG